MQRSPSILLVLLLTAGHAGWVLAAQPPGSSATTVCKDGSSFTFKGGCGGHGGIDRAATRERAEQFRDTQAMGARDAARPDEVWAMPATKSYLCHGDRDFGRAGEGQFMAEAQARAKGLHRVHGRCGTAQHHEASR